MEETAKNVHIESSTGWTAIKYSAIALLTCLASVN